MKKHSPDQPEYIERVLGLLPMSHIYSLEFICHASVYRGDGVIVLPKFEFEPFLKAIQEHKINGLYLVCCFDTTRSERMLI